MGLKERAMRGAAWDIGCSVAGQIVQIAMTAIVARILAPSDFGIYGMALVFIGFLQIFSQLGMGAALVQRQDITEEHLSSVFWLNIVTGVVLCLLYMAAAYPIALFFRQPILTRIIMIVSFNFVLSSLVIVQATILIRELNFKKLALINFSSLILTGTISIVLAVFGFGIWSLVLGPIGGGVLSAILLWTATDWKPAMIYSQRRVNEMLSFSVNVLGLSSLGYLKKNGQDILIGKCTGPLSFGFYSMANRIVLLPVQLVSAKISGIAFPLFSKIQHELDTAREGYLKTTFFITTFVFPVMSGLILTAPDFIPLIIGNQWKPTIFLVQVLSVSGFFQSLEGVSASMVYAQGRADVQFKWGLLSCVGALLMVAIGLRWGINGAAISYVASVFITTPILVAITLRIIRLSARDYVVALTPAVACSMIMIVLLQYFRYTAALYFKMPAIMSVLFCVFFGALVYVAAFNVLFPRRFRELLTDLRSLIPGTASAVK